VTTWDESEEGDSNSTTAICAINPLLTQTTAFRETERATSLNHSRKGLSSYDNCKMLGIFGTSWRNGIRYRILIASFSTSGFGIPFQSQCGRHMWTILMDDPPHQRFFLQQSLHLCSSIMIMTAKSRATYPTKLLTSPPLHALSHTHMYVSLVNKPPMMSQQTPCS